MKYRIKVVQERTGFRYYPQYRKWYGWWRGFVSNYWASYLMYFDTELEAKVFIENEKNKEDTTYVNC